MKSCMMLSICPLATNDKVSIEAACEWSSMTRRNAFCYGDECVRAGLTSYRCYRLGEILVVMADCDRVPNTGLLFVFPRSRAKQNGEC